MMTVDGREDINEYSFIISKTSVEGDVYSHVIRERFEEAGLHDVDFGSSDSITMLRVFIMNPFVAEWEGHGSSVGFIASFVDALLETVQTVASEMVSTHRTISGGANGSQERARKGQGNFRGQNLMKVH
jgi:hypothetical protein